MLLESAFEAAAPLSQVVFIHDYLQLAFQDTGLSLYTRVTLETERGFLHRTDSGFCDALVGLIGQRVASVDYQAQDRLRLSFGGGVTLVASLRAKDASGPELFEVNRPGVPPIVEEVA